MDEFLQLNWGIKGPHELDLGPEFIPEDEISTSYVFTGLPSNKTSISEIAKTKEKVTRQPSVPGRCYDFKSTIRSFLFVAEQEKCLTALKLIQAGRKPSGLYQQGAMELYNNVHQRILQENEKFTKFAEEQFNSAKVRVFKLRPLLKVYSKSLWKRKLERCQSYKQFYKKIDVLPYSYKEEEEPVEMIHVQNLLELGTLAKFSGPTLLKPFHLKLGCLPKKKISYNSNQSVSKDVNIDGIVKTNEIHVVISSSGLNRLLNFTKTTLPWDIPVVVKEVLIENGDGTKKTKNVVFIDKLLPNKSPSEFDLNEKCAKILMKSNFCDVEAFSFQTTENPIDTYDILKKQTNPSPNNNEEKTDLIDDVIGEVDTKRIKLDEVQSNNRENQKKGGGNQIHHNVSYRLWRLQLKNEQSGLMKSKYQSKGIQVLIRCKLDGCESIENGQLQPIGVAPKIEYHLEYGVCTPTKDELVRQWVYAYFRPYSQIRRIRTQYSKGEVVAIENCTVQKITSEAQTYHQFNPHLGLGVLYKIFHSMKSLTPGNYLLHYLPKNEAFVALLQETDERSDGVYNLYDEYNETKCKIHPDRKRKWHRIDTNFILPRHTADMQMPGLFKPRIFIPYAKRIKGKKKSKKTKKKVAGKKT